MTVQPTRDQLRALADAATEGPWEADHSEEDNSSVKVARREWWDGLAFAGRQGDAEFIAASRTAVPALLDALDQAERERDEAQAAVSRVRTMYLRQRGRPDGNDHSPVTHSITHGMTEEND